MEGPWWDSVSEVQLVGIWEVLNLKVSKNDPKIVFQMCLLLASDCICKLQFCIEFDIDFSLHRQLEPQLILVDPHIDSRDLVNWD